MYRDGEYVRSLLLYSCLGLLFSEAVCIVFLCFNETFFNFQDVPSGVVNSMAIAGSKYVER